ncbi:hypothetical protein, partial [Escherichia coli]|uniref:hypothetical protein n=1 Tax=Escherichia coli TaxID=562 RepID=UPI00215AECA5
ALAAALSEAGPGTVVRLAPGSYGSLGLRGLQGGPDAPNVLRSSDPADPARLSGLVLREVAHDELRDLHFDYTFEAGHEIRHRP